MAKERPNDSMMASSTGSSADVVGLWSQESDATMAILMMMHFSIDCFARPYATLSVACCDCLMVGGMCVLLVNECR